MTDSVIAQIKVTKPEVQGPVYFFKPFGADGTNLEGNIVFGEKEMISFEMGSDLGEFLFNKKPTFSSTTLAPQLVDSLFEISVVETNRYQRYFMLWRIDTESFVKLKFKSSAFHAFDLNLRGESILKNEKYNEEKLAQLEKEVALETGTHYFGMHLLYTPGSGEKIKFNLEIEADSNLSVEFIEWPKKQKIDISSIRHYTKITEAQISPDGEKVAMLLTQTTGKNQSDTWLEMRSTKDGKLLRSFKGFSKVNNIQWIPQSQSISFAQKEKDEAMLWQYDFDKEPKLLLKGLKNLGAYQWSKSGDFLVYSVANKKEEKEIKTNLIQGMASRLPEFSNKSYLRAYYPNKNVNIALTTGNESTVLKDIRPDGLEIIFTTNSYDYSKSPFLNVNYFTMNLKSGQVDTLFTKFWGGEALYSPSGNEILFTGSPSMFSNLGENVNTGQQPNNFDNQAYIYNRINKSVDPITKNFDPAVNQAYWHPDGKKVFLIVTDNDFDNVYVYNREDKTFTKFKGTPDLTTSLALDINGKQAVATGSNTQAPHSLYSLDLRKYEGKNIFNPSKVSLDHIEMGDVKPWSFKTTDGVDIAGRYYLPPNFDSSKTYPMIVYYYGGTSPVSRSFAGRYPFNWYAANGYVVYIPQPRGTFGFGQKFSAEHVNNWGKTNAQDVIEGTKAFLDAHKFVDTKSVGCMGASYGGFMTMYLLTQTDLFSAAVSHAGISSLSSYWGEGYWGYLYSAVATANSYPWNRKDIYVDQSPLFQADKVSTPLLLTHGTSDTNVPPGESYQMYSALKILNKDVEFLEVIGQDHWVIDYDQYKVWKENIMAWFDLQLKKDPKWWNDLHPESKRSTN